MLALEFPPISHLFEWKEILFKGSPFAVNKTVLLLWAAIIIVGGLFLVAAKRKALVPSGVQNLMESGIEFVEKGIVLEVMGPAGLPWVPFMTTLFFFIFMLNIFEILPFIQFPATSRMAIPLYLALQTWLIMIIVGMKEQGPLHYLTNSLFPPGVPKALYILVTPIEFVSKFLVRPFSLAVRLFANLMAGHILLTVFYVLSAALWVKGPLAIVLPLPILMSIALTGFEVLVSVLQAYIFTILTAVYLNESIHPEH